MSMEKCTPLALVMLLSSYIYTSTKTYKLIFIQKVGFDEIEWHPHHLYTRPLLELLQMQNMYYRVEPIDDDKDKPKIG